MSTELRKHVASKERKLQDLIQFVRTRTDRVPNYTLLLGAGASVTSGVRSASELINTWLTELYYRLCQDPHTPFDPDIARQYFSREHPQWYSRQREYSSLFEKKFDLPRQRRMFVEQEVASKLPSLGYAYLIRLVREDYFNTIFTTNFDDLLNEAFHQFSDVRPIVCAHDSSIASITVTSKRPKIVKLHGDYLFDDIKSTVRETESLEENTKKKFAEFAKDHGLIVAGYGGHDRSVMDVLQHMLKHEDFLKHGVYWCVRPNEKPSDELVKLLWRERAYWVEIDGFDELMAQLYQDCGGTEVPINTLLVSYAPKEMMSRFCTDHYLSASKSPVIQRDLAILRKELDRENVVESLRSVARGEQNEEHDAEDISDRDLLKLMAIQQRVDTGALTEALDLVKVELSRADNPVFHSRLLRSKLSLENGLGDTRAALKTCEALIETDPVDASSYLLKANNELQPDSRLGAICKAVELDRYYPSAFRVRAKYYQDQLRGDPEADPVHLTTLAMQDYEESIRLDPSLANAAYSDYFSFLSTCDLPAHDKNRELEKVLERIAAIDPLSHSFFKLSVNYAARSKTNRDVNRALTKKILEASKNQPRARRKRLQLLYLRSLVELGFSSDLLSEIGRYDLDDEWTQSDEYVRFRASIAVNIEGKLPDAIRLLEGSKRCKKDPLSITMLVHYLCFARRLDEASAIQEECKGLLTLDRRRRLERIVEGARGNHERVLASVRQDKERRTFHGDLVVHETHELLKLSRCGEAETIARRLLEVAHFRPQFDHLIINYELARIRQGNKGDKGRLAKVADRNPSNHLLRALALLLLDDKNKATEAIHRELEENKGLVYEMRDWAIFDLPANRAWLTAALRPSGLETIAEYADRKKAG
jgi:hypothetical protein